MPGYERRVAVTELEYSHRCERDRDAKESFCTWCLKTKAIGHFMWRGHMGTFSPVCEECKVEQKGKGGLGRLLPDGRLEEGIENAKAERLNALDRIRALWMTGEPVDAHVPEFTALCKIVVLCSKRIEDFEERIALEALGRIPPEEEGEV